MQQNPLPLLEAAEEEQAAWLVAALARPAAAPDALADFMVGSTPGGLPLSPSFYGCMHQYCPVRCLAGWWVGGKCGALHACIRARPPPFNPPTHIARHPASCRPRSARPQGITFDQLRGAVQRARMSTRTRVAMLEQEAKALRKEAADLRDIVRGYQEVEARVRARRGWDRGRQRRTGRAAGQERSGGWGVARQGVRRSLQPPSYQER